MNSFFGSFACDNDSLKLSTLHINRKIQDERVIIVGCFVFTLFTCCYEVSRDEMSAFSSILLLLCSHVFQPIVSFYMSVPFNMKGVTSLNLSC